MNEYVTYEEFRWSDKTHNLMRTVSTIIGESNVDTVTFPAEAVTYHYVGYHNEDT